MSPRALTTEHPFHIPVPRGATNNAVLALDGVYLAEYC